MRIRNGFVNILFLQFVVYTLLIVLQSTPVVYAQNSSISQQIKQLSENIRSAAKNGKKQPPSSGEPARFHIGADGYLRHIGAPPSHYFPVTSVALDKPKETAYNFMKEYERLFGVVSEKVDFRILKSKQKDKCSYVRFEQTYSGLPIFVAQVIVQVNESGGIEYVLSDIVRNVKALDKGDISIVPLISSVEANIRGIDLFTAENPNVEIKTTTPLLKIFAPSVLGSDGSIRLVWDMKVYSEETVFINEHILMDAHSGEIVRHYPLNRTILSREIYDSNNTTADPGTLVRDQGDPPSGITEVDNAYDFIGDAFGFYFIEHSRDGIDNDGMNIEVTVRYCSTDEDICGKPPTCPCRNAFYHWGIFTDHIYFGDFYAVDDVVGHEYTHGVTNYESDLVYEGQSGAINESFSDVWGEFIDLTNGVGNDTANVRWEIGEDLAGGALRDMSDPPAFNDPDRMGSPFYYTGDNDNGGVHTNSGVNNKLCFLLTDGDTFNGQDVTGEGINRIADLYYEVQDSNLISSGGDYADLYYALSRAAVNLGWNAESKYNLYKACLAVEIVEERNIYVDWRNDSGYESGTFTEPFDTVTEGYNIITYPGDNLIIESGTYNETITFDKTMKIKAKNGVVTIGQ